MKLSLRLAIYFIAPVCYCQNPGNVPGNSLWLEPSTFNDSTFVKTTDLSVINARHFNFNPVLDPLSQENTSYKNLLEDRYSFFAVFKSDTDTELQVATLKRGRYNVDISNKGITSNLEMPYSDNNPKKGILLGFVVSNQAKGKKNNCINIGDFYKGDTGGKQQLMEVLYYPRMLKPLERRKVETYLSLKYGISITGDANYVGSSGDTIWKQKTSQDFGSRVTGIGRDDLLHLYQKQSGNAEKDGIYIGFGSIDTTNTHNKYEIKDKSFMLWGDNNKTIELKKKDDSAIRVIDRIWKMQLEGVSATDSIVTQLRISKKEMMLGYVEGKDVLWLAVNDVATSAFDYVGARFIKQSAEDEDFVYFNTVQWDSNSDGSDTFTLVKGPDYFVEYNPLANCSEALPGSVQLKINGGTAPYTISVNQGEQTYTATTEAYTVNGLAEGQQHISIRDSSNNSVSIAPVIDYLAGSGVSLGPVWQLDKTGQVVVTPTALSPDGLSYAWFKANGGMTSGAEFTAVEAGNYTLEVTNTNGCTKQIPFSVIPANSGWSIYPNPIKSGGEFNLTFDLDKESEIGIRINSLEGKSYLDEKLGRLQHHTFTYSLITSGVYMVTVTVNGTEETTKLIVK